ncbi:hypothetical protein [Vibrio parahaemolyticus]|uniref:hypothetical protein n=1 Tax=Vibrio parahaemolyticus TaxID=670 RepID=UPI001123AC36|nr:hypothetical protein [Vibrio parahaemolyticus]EGQ9249968.1 hypothetical protein [Vibrio parahaemolyticus]TOE80543.1 hypothetical protein CGJ34_24015 [Vibrio parahaemolyticus]TOM02554.1 hypothetical protein CGH85_23380 [Vibrio parahaemolyticus]TOP27016.1 hypothetical protein CGH19_23270 [Vibrio parahaemolyticus]
MFFCAATFGLTELNFFAETLLVEFVGTKADLLAEMTFSLVWKVHVVSLSCRFETTPDLSASKYIKFIVCKV